MRVEDLARDIFGDDNNMSYCNLTIILIRVLILMMDHPALKY